MSKYIRRKVKTKLDDKIKKFRGTRNEEVCYSSIYRNDYLLTMCIIFQNGSEDNPIKIKEDDEAADIFVAEEDLKKGLRQYSHHK